MKDGSGDMEMQIMGYSVARRIKPLSEFSVKCFSAF